MSPIATRTLKHRAGHDVVVEVAAPIQVGENFRCEVRIVGLGDERNSFAMGVDGMQALILALTHIGNTLYAAQKDQGVLLTWEGLPKLGFPVGESIAKVLDAD